MSVGKRYKRGHSMRKKEQLVDNLCAHRILIYDTQAHRRVQSQQHLAQPRLCNLKRQRAKGLQWSPVSSKQLCKQISQVNHDQYVCLSLHFVSIEHTRENHLQKRQELSKKYKSENFVCKSHCLFGLSGTSESTVATTSGATTTTALPETSTSQGSTVITSELETHLLK